jgi:hypothetical protein
MDPGPPRKEITARVARRRRRVTGQAVRLVVDVGCGDLSKWSRIGKHRNEGKSQRVGISLDGGAGAGTSWQCQARHLVTGKHNSPGEEDDSRATCWKLTNKQAADPRKLCGYVVCSSGNYQCRYRLVLLGDKVVERSYWRRVPHHHWPR